MVACVLDSNLVVFVATLAVVLFLFVLLHVCDSDYCDEIAVDVVIVFIVFLIFFFFVVVGSWTRSFLSQ
jgi:hypothetical protein